MLTFQPSEKILPVLPGVGDGAGGVLATDVHVLDDLDLGVALDERLVGVIGAGRVVGRHERRRGVVDERRVRDGFLDAVDEALHAALRPVLGRVATGDREVLEVQAVGLHVVDDDLGGLAALLVGDLGEVRELVAVRLDADGEDRDARGHDSRS